MLLAALLTTLAAPSDEDLASATAAFQAWYKRSDAASRAQLLMQLEPHVSSLPTAKPTSAPCTKDRSKLWVGGQEAPAQELAALNRCLPRLRTRCGRCNPWRKAGA